ncbi:hypothetical protein CXF68_08215 [Tenacibaculum sp. Bg11-29]|uniref:hypothetical protein n=1 Tax=Tenacibaculum sp. Bg11-29 TaxID=2058306 RepID=UPI000C340F88|nr:hypothetical protein [Tenacibaculum sp. Bg11-29]PKH50681.1 hypothetical protein CXF68_08215 [Tenacibaculum sp. Bg11-29]
MKKFNLALKITLLFIAFLTFNFTSKTNNNLTTKTNFSKASIVGYTKKLIISYDAFLNDSEKAQIRACISSELNTPISQISNCSNGNEILYFDQEQLYFRIPGIGVGVDDDELDQLPPGGIVKSKPELLQILAPCGNNFAFAIYSGSCNTNNNLLFHN